MLRERDVSHEKSPKYKMYARGFQLTQPFLDLGRAERLKVVRVRGIPS